MCYDVATLNEEVIAMSKPIKKLVNVCDSAALWYVGSYMLEFLMQRERWENPDTKNDFIRYMFEEYGAGDGDISGTRTRVNAMIRIIESRRVEEALEEVLKANDSKLGCPQAKINAQIVLDKLNSGELTY